MRIRHTIPNDRARHPWDRPAPEPGHPASRPLRWGARLLLLGFIAASVYPAIGDTGVDVAVTCDPTRVGVATTCRATIAETNPTTGTSSLPTEGMPKSIARGVFTRDNFPPAGSPIRIITKKIYWDTLEATRDVVTLAPIESVLDTAESRGFDGVRLRFSFGADAPQWAKAIGDGPIDYLEAQSDTQTTIPDIWDPAYQAEVEELMVAVAARYDADPRVLLVFASGAQTYYSEPFMRGISAQQNRTNLLAAGYTKALDQAAQRWQLDIMRVFRQTSVGLAYNPWQFINPDGSAGVSVAYAAEVMDYHLSLFGDRTVLQNNSIRSSYIADPPAIYAEFLSRLDDPGTTQYQVAGATRVGDADATMHWAIDYLKASGVELVNGYPTFHTDAELIEYDAALTGDTTPPVTHDVSWSASGNGTFSGSSCEAGGVGETTCTVRYQPGPGSAGEHTITATYSGSAISTGSVSTLLRVSPRLSATTLTCATPVPAGTKSSCAANVSDKSGGQVSAPMGTVRIVVDGVVSASCELAGASGSASGCTVDVVAASGTQQVTARYGGDTDHAPSASGAIPLTGDAPPEEPPSEEPPPEEPPAPPADTTAPVVQILSPADGTAIQKGRTIKVVATATDDVGVINVEFAADGVVICSDVETTAMSCAWSVPKRGSTGFTVTVTARDAAGNVGTQQIAIVVVTGRP